jgi:hypothetical protein
MVKVMERKIFIVLIFICAVIVVTCILLWKFVIPRSSSLKIEVTLAHSVTCQIGDSDYTFKLYPYSNGIYLLRVEKGNNFETKVVVSGQNYRFFDLEVHVVKLVFASVLLEVKKA